MIGGILEGRTDIQLTGTVKEESKSIIDSRSIDIEEQTKRM